MIVSTIRYASKCPHYSIMSNIPELSPQLIPIDKKDEQEQVTSLDSNADEKAILVFTGGHKRYIDPNENSIRKLIKEEFTGYRKRPYIMVAKYPYKNDLVYIHMIKREKEEIDFIKVAKSGSWKTVVEKIEMLPAIIRDYIDGELIFEREFRWEEAGIYDGFQQEGRAKEQACSLLEKIVEKRKKKKAEAEESRKRYAEKNAIGYVYLLRVGNYYKIGKADQLDRRIYQLKIALPEEPVFIHAIETSDPYGIEQYWHRRYKDYRRGGEFFELPDEAVEEFKTHKRVL